METVTGALAAQLDEAVAGTTYIGEALPGSLFSVAAWRIKKVVEVGADVTITWADGNSDFDNVWDDRLSLTYI
jgi:hypothetical protein